MVQRAERNFDQARISDMHGAQRSKMLSSLFHVDVQPHHDVKVQCQANSHAKTSSNDNHMLSHAAIEQRSRHLQEFKLTIQSRRGSSDALVFRPRTLQQALA